MTSRQSHAENRQLRKLPRSFYLRPTLTVAKDLLGKYLVRQYKGRTLVGKIVEAEAYRGAHDPASHAYRGRTKRNDAMFREGGHLYVYFTYGMHFCVNVVTGKAGTGEAVLIRAIEPLKGIDVMMKNRLTARSHKKQLRDVALSGIPPQSGILSSGTNGTHVTIHPPPVNLTNGPAKLCEALAIRRGENAIDLLGAEIYFLNSPALPSSKVGRSARIGIAMGKEKQWRFYIRGNPWVSR
ncbi:MAG: 3-Methyladenine glycosylase [Bacteroidetes bacterium]|nr:3-Methyladenine glycosylase [Bacteroidota bacterium]